MNELARIDELSTRLNKYDHLEIQVDDFALSVFNKNNRRLLTLYRKPQGDIYGRILFTSDGREKIVLKPQFDRAINHLWRIANDIKES